MAILELPLHLRPPVLACSLCHVSVTLDKATIGLPKAGKTAGLSCISHFWELELLIVGWADFITRERREYERHYKNSVEVIYANGGDNARLDA